MKITPFFLGIVYDSQGKKDDALVEYRKCLAIQRKVLGEEHPDVATSLNNIGT